MVDNNADRAHVPGQQPVPERDIEPLWPPDQIDGGPGVGTPPWAADPSTGAPPPAAPPPVPRPATGQSPAAPPSPADYPSLTGGVPAPGGWAMTGQPGASSWAPTPPAQGWTPPVVHAPPNPATGPTVPPAAGPGARPTTDASGAPAGAAAATATPDAATGGTPPAVPAPRVDLDLPFTLDQPAPAGPAPAIPPAGPATGPDALPASGGDPTDRTSQGARPEADGPAPAPDETTPSWASGTTPPGTSSSASGRATVGGAAPTTASGRAAVGGSRGAESPWAQPPQRTGAAGAEPATGSTTPTTGGPGPARQGTGPETPQASGPGPQPTSGGVPPQFGPPPPGPQQHAPAPPQQAAPPQAAPTPPPGPYPPQSGPYPPQSGWYPPPWQPGGTPAPPQSYQPAVPQPAVGVPQPSPAYPDPTWRPEAAAAPTAEDFARRRQVRPADPVASMGVRAVANKIGLRLPPGRHEQELRRDIEMVRRNFGGLRQVTVVNPKGGAGKTVAILLLAMTFGQKRGGYVLAWDNNETQGTLGMRAQQDFHARTVRDMLRDLGQFQGHGRVGDLSQYVRSQGEGMFDVLASDESATGGEMLTAAAFAEIREVVSRFYKLIFVDTGNNVRAQNWQAAMDATDQLVVTMSARNDSAETAARMLDHLEQSGRQRLVRQAVTVVSMPPSRKEIDLPAIQEHFAARTRAVLLAPYERLIDTGEPIRYAALSSATRDAWLKIAAAVAEGL
ncbi:chromosome partitioning protein [Micromonospora sp. URMC 106]|uniref:chromosome partitioning protein n=1 Tax=Micromonospora sp. URMC 106 TaxID=3423408 RepID=UPI003F1C4D9D